ncbi:hypothetical protein MNB_SV-13-57 [hydrothermal vent metagenome]|uniref:Uncharacterized protein n=1 Tax=hydrothermal vent metagenome TaxID=652676 RepID=A0A1W1CZR1_9ZZZZ
MLSETLYFLMCLLPFVIILTLSWNKNPKFLTLGMIISFCIVLLLYDNYILSQVVSLFESEETIIKAMEENRGLVLVDGLFVGLFISITYVSFLALVFWNFPIRKTKNSFQTFREYKKTSEFYALIALIFSLNFNLGNLREFFFFADPSFFGFLLSIFLIAKALDLDMHSKIAWLSIKSRIRLNFN